MVRIPSASSMFQTYASLSTSITLFKTILNQVVPSQLQHYISLKIQSYFRTSSSDKIVLVIEQKDGMGYNEVYIAAEIYLSSKTSPGLQRFKLSKNFQDPNINVKFGSRGKIVDTYEGIEMVWQFVHDIGQNNNNSTNMLHNSGQHGISPFSFAQHGHSEPEKRYFELSFNKQHKDKILNHYIPYVLNQAKIMSDEKKVVKLYSLANGHPGHWDSVNLEHPSTFDTLALEPTLKKAIIQDLDRFLKRKEFYRRVGKAWKRGYLLYGPPGTGKSSLIAAIANYLKFDIYDLEFSNIRNDSELRRLWLSTKNRSILVIEDIDCSVELPDRTQNQPGLLPDATPNQSAFLPEILNHPAFRRPQPRDQQFTLAGFLNVIDGLWSSCGDERVIIFTTNHKEKLDPALLRPGRMDMHIHMSYLTTEGFKILAANYLEIHDPQHGCFQDIQKLIESVQVTPAEVAEEFMKSEDADVCLGNLVNFLKRKRDSNDHEEIKENGGDMDQGIKRTKTFEYVIRSNKQVGR